MGGRKHEKKRGVGPRMRIASCQQSLVKHLGVCLQFTWVFVEYLFLWDFIQIEGSPLYSVGVFVFLVPVKCSSQTEEAKI